MRSAAGGAPMSQPRNGAGAVRRPKRLRAHVVESVNFVWKNVGQSGRRFAPR
jgi:hypothetical protein